MQIFIDRTYSRQTLAALMVAVILTTILMVNVFMPIKRAQAVLSTLPAQIIQYILDKIAWAKDYAMQQLQKYYEEITSQIEQWTKWDILDQRALKDTWNSMRAELLEQLSNDILEWAQGSDGNTNFVSDWKGHLTEQTNAQVRDFLDTQVSNTNMCNNFKNDVQNTVRNMAESKMDENYLNEATKCSSDNISAFMDDFTNGGWDAWEMAIMPSGNFYGSLLLSYDELMGKATQIYEGEDSKLTANQGYKGDDENTPGIIQSYASQRASMMDFDYLLQSDELNEYVSSLADAFINRIKNEGLKNMSLRQTSSNRNEKPNVVVPPEMQDYNFVAANEVYVNAILDMLPNILDSLNSLRGEQRTAEQLMIEVKEEQDRIIACRGEGALASPYIGPELSRTQSEMATTTERINQIDDISLDLITTIAAIDEVLAAHAANDEEAMILAIENFKAEFSKVANDNGTGSLQIFLNTNETNPERLSDETAEFNLSTEELRAYYIGRIGSDRRGVARQMPETLEGQLYLEQRVNCF